MKKIYILDALGYIFRSYYAIRHLTRPSGESTNALYGFIRAILKLRQDFSPTHLVAVFDGPNNTKLRRELYKDYKANRLHPPEDLPYQIEWAYEFCKLAKIPTLRVPDVEADDVIAALALWTSNETDAEAMILSSDKDLFQLVRPDIHILNTNKNNLLYDRNQVKEHFGVWPEQIRDYLAIVGDSSDNVPGIKGFGPKTAQNLLEQAKTLEEIKLNPEKYLNEKKCATFKDHLPQLVISEQLVTLNTNVEIEKDVNFYQLGSPSPEALQLFFEDMNFKSLAKEFQKKTSAPKLPTPLPPVKIINDIFQLDKLVEILKTENTICIDTETSELNPLKAEIVGLGIGLSPSQLWYIPFNSRLSKEDIVTKIRPLFQNPKIHFFGHHIKYDLHILKNIGIDTVNVCDDTLLLSYLLTPHLHQHSLDSLSLQYFDHQKIPIKELIGSGSKQKSMMDVEVELAAQYCAEDVWVTLRLKELLHEKVSQKNLLKVYQNIELPLVHVLFKMERHGIYIDKKQLLDLRQMLNKQLTILEAEAHQMAEEPFNLKSPKQLGVVLFEKLKITPGKKTKTGFATDAQTLETLEHEHPIITRILEFRQLEKLRSTYVESLVEETYEPTQRIHCSFNQAQTATGRLSCHNPNLQNIPVKTEQGREVRKAFRPQKEGWSFLSADYSQIELRLLAHYSEDPQLVEAFLSGGDIHTSTAAKVFGIDIDQVSKEQRSLAKAVNFGIIYGQQAFGLSKQLKISIPEAKEFIDTYFDKYPKVKEYLQNSKEQAARDQFAITLFGRKRPLEEINSSNKLLKQAAERLAVNTPFQGSNADIIKIAMAKIDQKFKEKGFESFMVLQIHDELLFEVKDNEIQEISNEVKQIMESIISLKVPLTIDIKIGKNWKEC